MKLFLVSVALVISLALACAESDQVRGLRGGRWGNGSDGRDGGRGGGRGGRGAAKDKLGFLQAKVDEKCETLECPVDASSVNCNIEKPERSDVDWEDLAEEEKAALKGEKKAKMDDYVDALALCVCCTDTSLEDILPDKEDRIEEKCGELECPADPADLDCDIDKSALTEEERAALKEEREGERGEFRERLALCVCCADDFELDKLFSERPKGKGKSRPEKIDTRKRSRSRKSRDKLDFLQEKVNGKCGALECPADASSVDCDIDRPEHSDIDWEDLTEEEKAALKGEKKAKMDDYVDALALCVCCTDNSLENVLPDKEDRIEEKCGALECPADPAVLDCNLDKPTRANADRANLTEEEWAALKKEREGERDEFRERLALCVCCAEDFELGELFSERPKGKGRWRPGKFRGKFGGKL